jgi:hypothetical protein
MVFVLNTPSWSITGDLDRDGDVDFDDFFLFSDNFGNTGEVETTDCGEETTELLTWTTTWDDGSVKKEYQYYYHPENNRRIKNGWYNSYDENGELNGGGTYRDGNKWSGEFWVNVTWGDNYGLIETDEDPDDLNSLFESIFGGLFTYENGLWNGLGISYYINGNKYSEGQYKDGENNGYYESYLKSGELREKANFVDGKLDGNRIFYDREGNITDEDIYENGVCVECEGLCSSDGWFEGCE